MRNLIYYYNFYQNQLRNISNFKNKILFWRRRLFLPYFTIINRPMDFVGTFLCFKFSTLYRFTRPTTVIRIDESFDFNLLVNSGHQTLVFKLWSDSLSPSGTGNFFFLILFFRLCCKKFCDLKSVLFCHWGLFIFYLICSEY